VAARGHVGQILGTDVASALVHHHSGRRASGAALVDIKGLPVRSNLVKDIYERPCPRTRPAANADERLPYRGSDLEEERAALADRTEALAPAAGRHVPNSPDQSSKVSRRSGKAARH
jgi:hypothetical protein